MKAQIEKAAGPRPPRTRRVRVSAVREGEGMVREDREVTVTGPEAETKALLDRLAPVYGQHVAFYAREYGRHPDAETPEEMAEGFAEYSRKVAAETPPRKLTWRHLSAVSRHDIRAGIELWEKIKQEAREHVATGAHTVEIVYPNTSPFDRARHFAVREEMAEGWQPQNGVEHALVDMLAVNYGLWLHWTGIAHGWATGFVEREPRDGAEYTHTWKPPRVSESEAVEQAHRLADSYNRQFLRVLRQLRDLRRYAPPVIVNNGGQVNVANQQVNVTSVD